VACEWLTSLDVALYTQLVLATIHGLTATSHDEPGSFSWDATAAALAG
jgi:hypothetical protein